MKIEKLLEKVKAGDTDALNIIYERYSPMMRSICFSVSIRSTPYCKSQNNVVPLHGGIIFLILRQEYAI